MICPVSSALVSLAALDLTVMPPPRRSSHWANLSLSRPLVMGILNVTPDSFSDAGHNLDPRMAIAAGLAMSANGADIIDIGGESTRPGAAPVMPGIEQERIIQVIRALAAQGILVSVDSRNAATMQAGLAAGGKIVNDVSGLTHDPRAAGVVAAHGCPVVIMHTRGTPATMAANASYQDVVAEVRDELSIRIATAIQAGIRPEQIAIDPGIGFAKRPAASQAVLRGLPALVRLNFPVLVGVSRKGFIGDLSREPQADQRLGGSLAAGLFAVMQGASILRVHDVRATVHALRVWHTLFEPDTVSLS